MSVYIIIIVTDGIDLLRVLKIILWEFKWINNFVGISVLNVFVSLL